MISRYIIPPIALLATPFAIQYFANVTRTEDQEEEYSLGMIFGNPFSWLVISCWLLGNASLLMIPFDKYNGKSTKFGTTPEYTDNFPGTYMTLIGSYLGFHSMWWFQSMFVCDNYAYIIGNMYFVALLLSLYLWYQGKKNPQSKEKLESGPILYELCHGMELHPRILNDTVDVKQWIVPRSSFLSWQLLIIAFFYGTYQVHGFNWGYLCNVTLQSAYIANLIFREKALLASTAITRRRPGFYLLCESLCFLPVIQTFSSYYFSRHLPDLPFFPNLIIFLVGIAFSGLLYVINTQKELFKLTNGNCKIWGGKAKYVESSEEPSEGRLKPRLLISGFWGLVRHPTYLVELVCAVCWCLPGINFGIYPFVYCIYLLIVLVPRILRNEADCAEKYGPLWQKYCQTVKYRIIPFIF